VKILTEISGIFGKFFPEISGDFPRGQNQIYGCIFAFCHFFWGENPGISGISEFPKFPEIGENPGEISEDFDEKKTNLPAVFLFSPLSKIREIPGENFGKISGKFREISENSGNFSPGDIFQNPGNFGEKPLQKYQFYGCVFRFHPFLSGGSPRFPENSGKLILTNFGKFRKFFSDGTHFGKFRENFP
jgi:hypothetical protein